MTYRDRISLEQLKQQLTRWRAANSAPTPIPDRIWCGAAQLASRHGVGQVARALRLDYAALKRKALVSEQEAMAPVVAPTAFIELVSPPPAPIGRCVLEIESARGNEMRLKMREVTPAALGTILREVLA